MVIGTGDVGGEFDAAIAPTGSLAVAWESNYRINASLAAGPMATLQRGHTVSPPHQGAAAPSIAIAGRGQARVLSGRVSVPINHSPTGQTSFRSCSHPPAEPKQH